MTTITHLDAGESFFQREPLTARLKNLIHDYPEGVGILKELIQNADDAGATKIEVIIDWRTHVASQLPDPEMKELLGPAILVYNDAVFTENDFTSIKNLGVSGKREDLQKTGRFGVGFNSVYHVTDYPNFISRDRIVFFDPNLSAIPNISNREPGRSWNLDQSQWWKDYSDFMRIYEIGGLQPGSTDFKGTLFRLSLRTAAQAKRSEIRQQPFEQANLQELLTELENNADELLLFLKSLIEVRVREVAADGSSQELISIVTQNAEEVTRQRQTLQSALKGGLDALIHNCRTGQLPSISYLHTIQTTTRQTQTTTTWRVCSLLRADENGELVNTIEQLANQGQKAIPWAGAAACLSRIRSGDESELPQLAGRAYCFLPLPQITGLPVHVNGFFDLDSSRRELTNDDLTGRDRIRVLWNQLLIRHVLAHAYANLISDLVQDIGEVNPISFYQFFPISANGGLKELPRYVLQLLHTKPVIRSGLPHTIQHQEKRKLVKPWIAPNEILLLPKPWQNLVEPLSKDALPIADPPLPDAVQTAFKQAGISLKSYSSADLRSHLKTQDAFACEISEAPKASLRKQEWIICLLQYCLHDRHRDVRHLPLAILSDGKLHNFSNDQNHYPYSASPKLREIFANYPTWFLATDLLEKVPELVECRGVRPMTPTQFAHRLKDVIDPSHTGEVEWQPSSIELPNAAWLAQVYQYLASLTKEELPIDDLQEVPIVPGNDQALHYPGKAQTPLWLNQASNTEMLEALMYFKIPIMQAEQDLQKAIADFIQRHPETLIYHLTAPDLVDTLESIDDFPGYHKQHYQTLLGFLAKERIALAPSHIECLKHFPIYFTSDDQLTDLSNVYLPGGYEPPAIAASVKLLRLGETTNSQEWKPLLMTLKVPELSRDRLILEYLLPNYEYLSSDNQKTALIWIRDHLNQAQKSFDEKQQGEADFKQIIAKAPLVYCNDGELHPIARIYMPSSYPVVHKILGDRAYMPNMDFYHEDEVLWENFFHTLGILRSPSTGDLIAHIDTLIDRAKNYGVEDVTESLQAIFKHIVDHWEMLSLPNANHAQGVFAEALKARAWLPPERREAQLAKYPGYIVPADTLCRSNQIAFIRDAHLVASQKPILNIARSEIPRGTLVALGFQPVQLADVIQHFKKIIELADQIPETVRSQNWQRSLVAIYKHLKDSSNQAAHQQQIRQQLAGLKCLWDGEKLWQPKHTFQENVTCFGRHRKRINNKELRDVYELLGQKPTPEVNDYLTFVQELADRANGNPLNDEDAECILQTLLQLWAQINSSGAPAPTNLQLLTEDNRLFPAMEILIPDAPWRLEGVRQAGKVSLLHPKLYQTCCAMAKAVGSASLAKDIDEEYQDFQESEQTSAKELCYLWRNHIKTHEFQMGLLRLIMDEHNLQAESLPNIDWLNRARIYPAKEIYINLSWNGKLIAEDVSGDYHFSEERKVFYIRFDQEDQEVIPGYLAECLNYQIDEARFLTKHLGLLENLLEFPPERIATFLDKRRIQEYNVQNLSDLAQVDKLAEPQEDTIFQWETNQDLSDEDQLSEDLVPEDLSDEGIAIEDRHPSNATSPLQPLPNTSIEADLDTESQHDSSADSRSNQPVDNLSPTETSNLPESWILATAEDQSDSLEQSQFDHPMAQPQTAYRRTRRSMEILTAKSDSAGSPLPSKVAKSRISGTPRGRMRSHVPGEKITIITSRPSKGASGRSRKPGDQPKSRLINYVHPTATQPTDTDEIAIIEQAGVAKVIAYEQLQGRTAKDMNEVCTNHPGYDIESTDRAGNTRYIEVKSKRGLWDDLGVKMTHTQFDTALNRQDEFWLYVVERSENDREYKIYMIQNPATRVNEFFYDQGWKSVADATYSPDVNQ